SAYAVRGAAPAAVDGVALVASEAMTSSIRHASMRQLPGPLGVAAFGEDGRAAAIVEGDGACQRTREPAKDVGGNNRPGAPVAPARPQLESAQAIAWSNAQACPLWIVGLADHPRPPRRGRGRLELPAGG
ncbi:MAG: hypothetical protein M0014_13465, partial [Actinomycetota bacterium]|nr:hypothetical protein [Actinomycetota bacterium]